MKLALLLVSLIVFSIFTGFVMWNHHVLGFLFLAAKEPWALQMFLDLSIMLTLFGVWQWADAKKHGFNPWLHTSLLLLGSPGPLIYLVRRELKVRRN